jgi:hypothetical protein
LHVRGDAPTSHVDASPVQSRHTEPDCPHCASRNPGWQTLAESQHPRHVEGEHFGGDTQLEPLHTLFVSAQSTHATPPCPHESSDLPVRHVFPSQHPVQLFGPQRVTPLHVPPPPGEVAHVPPAPAQFRQSSPFWPQANESSPSRQVSPKQHPLQVPGPHFGSTHFRPTQTFPSTAQCAHASPLPPHSFASTPCTHLFPSQHPAQLVTSQRGVSIAHA